MLDPRTTLSIQVVFSLAAVAFLTGGYVLGGVPGAAWGLCLGSVCKAAATWTRVARLGRRAAVDQAHISASAATGKVCPVATPGTRARGVGQKPK
jgi:hypothetical protein